MYFCILKSYNKLFLIFLLPILEPLACYASALMFSCPSNL